MMSKKSSGRKSGGANRGYFYRSGRGWYASNEGSPKALRDPDGRPIKAAKTPHSKLREALARFQSNADHSARERRASQDRLAQAHAGVTVLDVCQAYLSHVKATGSEATHKLRADSLFDLCFGLPARYRKLSEANQGELNASQKKQAAADRIHPGYGRLTVAELLPLHIDQWLDAHPSWKGSRRSRIQAIKRALNYAKEKGLIATNPLVGYTTPKAASRTTYLTPEQEQAIIDQSRAEFAAAVRVCIRTGARPGVEFASLCRRHVSLSGERMEWTFKPEESKTGQLRVLRIRDPEVIEAVRERLASGVTGPLFRNSRGNPWKRESLASGFRSAKARAEKHGTEFDPDACMYSCRHTYAKRTLQGHWTGKPCNIETLAQLMGNSPEVCRDHYLQWSEIDNERHWDAS